MNLEGRIVRLRAVEPEDAELLYAWENDTSVWSVSGTTEPFSRAQMERFIAAQLQGGDLFRTGQLRLIVETRAEARPVGIADLFEFDPLNRRAGLGILIHDEDDRGRGYASDAVETSADTPANGCGCTSCGATWERTMRPVSGCSAARDSSPQASNANGCGRRKATATKC